MHKSMLASSLLAFCASVAAQGPSAYLVDSNLDQLFSVDLTTGAATFIASTLNNGLDTPADLTWRTTTNELWTIDLGGGEVGTIDVLTGGFTPLFQTNLSGWQGMAWDEGTQLFYLANQSGQLYTLDPVTGTTSLLGGGGTGLLTALETDANGSLFGVNFSTGVVSLIDKTTGALTPVFTTLTNLQGLGIDLNGTWYGTSTSSQSLYTIDPQSGTATLVGAHGAGVQFAKGFDVVTTGSNFATKVRFGQGCNNLFASFYESGPFDLSNTALQFINTGTGYLVLPTASTWYTPTSTPATFGDDVVVSFPLGWTLPYPGGVTNTLAVSSNGFVNGGNNTASGCCAFNIGQFLGSTTAGTGPCWAALWHDLNPSAGGTVHLDSDPVTQTAYVTFTNVPQYGTSNLNTFQYAFSVTGIVELRWQTCAVTTAGVGYSPANNNLDPGSMDISAATTILTSATDTLPVSLDASARPVLGTTIQMNVGNIPPGAPIAGLIYGLTKFSPGLPLAGIGMPGCFQYGSQEVTVLLIAPGSTASAPFGVPNNPAFAGVHVVVQAAVFDPAGGHNTLGALSSNGVELGFDIN
jgi:hypothetical protein